MSTRPATAPSCPICRRPRDAEHRPFCSKRCADIDLGRWLGGAYAIPTDEPATPDTTAPPSDESGGRGDEGDRSD